MSDEFVLSTTPPTEQEIDQRRVFEINSTLYDVFFNLNRARAAAETAANALEQFSLDPDGRAGHRRDAEPRGIHLHLLRRELLLRRAVQPAGRRHHRLRRSRRRRSRRSRRRWRGSTRRWPTRGSPADDGSDHRPRRRRSRPRPARSRALRRGGGGGGGRAHGVPVRHRARGEPAPAPERHLLLQRRLPLVGLGRGGRRGPAVSAPRRTRGCRSRTRRTWASTARRRSSPCSSTPTRARRWWWRTESRPVSSRPRRSSRAANRSGMTAILNDLRDLQGLDNLGTPGNQDAAIDLLFSERAFWMFATGHRLGDMRRLIRQYGRAAGDGLSQRGLPQGRILRRGREPADSRRRAEQPELAGMHG